MKDYVKKVECKAEKWSGSVADLMDLSGIADKLGYAISPQKNGDIMVTSDSDSFFVGVGDYLVDFEGELSGWSPEEFSEHFYAARGKKEDNDKEKPEKVKKTASDDAPKGEKKSKPKKIATSGDETDKPKGGWTDEDEKQKQKEDRNF